MYLLLEKWNDFVENWSVSEMKVLPEASLLHFNSHSWEKYQTGLAEKKEIIKKKKPSNNIKAFFFFFENSLSALHLMPVKRPKRSLWWISFGYWIPSISVASTVTPFFRSVADQNSLGHWSSLILKTSEIRKPLAPQTQKHLETQYNICKLCRLCIHIDLGALITLTGPWTNTTINQGEWQRAPQAPRSEMFKPNDHLSPPPGRSFSLPHTLVALPLLSDWIYY